MVMERDIEIIISMQMALIIMWDLWVMEKDCAII